MLKICYYSFMINSKLVSSFEDDSLTHFEYHLFDDEIHIGEYNLAIQNNKIYITLYKIYRQYRGMNFGKLGLREVNEIIFLLKNDFNFNKVELDAKPFDGETLSKNDLVKFYKKYLGLDVVFASSEELILSKNI